VNKNTLIFIIIIFVMLFAYYVWPTPYIYMSMTWNENTYPMRVNRITDETEICFVGVWTSMGKK
jgi:hypothetical protein